MYMKVYTERHKMLRKCRKQPFLSEKALKKPGFYLAYFTMVRMEGLEPACLAALDPKSSASTSFATSACSVVQMKRLGFYALQR